MEENNQDKVTEVTTEAEKVGVGAPVGGAAAVVNSALGKFILTGNLSSYFDGILKRKNRTELETLYGYITSLLVTPDGISTLETEPEYRRRYSHKVRLASRLGFMSEALRQALAEVSEEEKAAKAKQRTQNRSGIFNWFKK